MQVAILCVTHRSAELIADFAAALPAALAPLRARTVVVDSGSPDNTCTAVADLLPDADLCRLSSNRGFAAAINAGVEHVFRTGGADAVLILNPDIRLAPGSVPELLRVLDDPRVGAAAPRLVDETGALLYSLRRPSSVSATWCEAILGGPLATRLGLPSEVIRDAAVYLRPTDVGWATGGALMISARALAEVGPWEESYFLYEEEVDYLLRLRDHGFAVRYTPSAEATRLVGRASVPGWIHGLMATNRVRHMARRPGGRWRAPVFRAALLAGSLLRLVAGRREVYPAVWALSRAKRGPRAVMDRFRPDGNADVRARDASVGSWPVAADVPGVAR